MCQCACWMIFTSVVGIVFYLLDVITDIVNGVHYLTRGDTHWGIATLIFVALPALIYTFLLLIYLVLKCCSHHDADAKRYSTTQRFLKVPYWSGALAWLEPRGNTCCKRFRNYLLVLFRFEPVMSYFQRIGYILRGAKEELQRLERDFFQKKQLQIFIETCMESLPQIALQLYILGRKKTINGLQVMSLVLSIIGSWFVFMYIQVEKKQNVRKKTLWSIKLLWCIFGIFPTLVGSFSAISLFSALYNPYYMSFYVVLVISIIIKWLFITTLKRYNKLSIRTIIVFVVTLVKLGLLVMISLWYVTLKNLEEHRLLLSDLNVNDPKTFIPAFIWPSTTTFLKQWSLDRKAVDPVPAWAVCDRTTMFRNGTFVLDTRHWLSRGNLTDNVYAFLKEDELFCLPDIADFVFCTVFYCLLLWVVWDIFFYFIRCCVPSERDRDRDNDHSIALSERQQLV